MQNVILTPAEVVARDARNRELWELTAAVAGRLNRAQAELVEIAAELVAGGHWGDGGFTSPQHYLVVRAGLSPAHASDVVAMARRRSELPEATAALIAGELSLDQVAVVAHKVPAAYQASATALARYATVPQLRRAVARHAFAAGPPDPPAVPEAAGSAQDGSASTQPAGSESERRACARAELSMHYDRDGRFQLRYSAPATIGALVEQAVREAKDALFLRGQHPDQPELTADASDAAPAGRGGFSARSGAPSFADAIEEIAVRSLGSVASTSRRDLYRVYLHLSTDAAWVGGGHAIPLRLLGRFICDGVAQPVWETQGRPVSVGRTMRILPIRSRRLVQDRDRGCRFPGCTTTRFVEIHHLQPWADGGGTDLPNQVSLCPVHHDAIDRGDFTITGDPTRPDGLTVTNRYGLRVRPPTPSETAPPPGGDPPVPPGTYIPPTGGPLDQHHFDLPSDTDLLHRERSALDRHHLTPVTDHPRRDPVADPDDWLHDLDEGLVRDSYRTRVLRE